MSLIYSDYPNSFLKAIHGLQGMVKKWFSFEIYDFNGKLILNNNDIKLLSGSIDYGAFNDTNRKMQLDISFDKNIDLTNKRLRAYYNLEYFDEIHQKKKVKTWSIGRFILTSPKIVEKGFKNITASLEAYDYSYVLNNASIPTSFIISEGESFSVAWERFFTLLNLKADIEITQASAKNQIGYIQFEVAKDISDEIKNAGSFDSAFFDVNGKAIGKIYKPPSETAVTKNFLENEYSILHRGFEKDLDTFSVPNLFVASSVNSESSEIIRSAIINDSEFGSTSYKQKGFLLPIYYDYSNVPDAVTLQKTLRRNADQYLKTNEHLTFRSAFIPFMEHKENIYLQNSNINIDGIYQSIGWSANFKDNHMTHRVRRSVNV